MAQSWRLRCAPGTVPFYWVFYDMGALEYD